MPTTAVESAILTEAAKLKGIPYRMVPPPDGVNNLDCSLFVWTVLRNAGLPLPPGVRTAEQIRQACVRIDFNDVEPGDLVFFEHTYEPDAPPGPDGRIASHVGFSQGRGTLRMWDSHASDGDSGPPGVGETDISTLYWQEKIFEARRAPRMASAAVAASSAPGAQRFRLTTDGVRMRAAAGTAQPILVENLGAGTIVTAVDDTLVSANGFQWRHVKTADGTVGFVAAQFLERLGLRPGDGDNRNGADSGGTRFRLITGGVRLRAGRGTSQPILVENLGIGTIVTAVDDSLETVEGHQWRHVKTAAGIVGFVAAEFLGSPDVVPPGVLSIQDLYDLVRGRGAEPKIDRIMVAAALTESEGDPHTIGDNGHSAGLWQMHDGGLGAGMTLEQRMNPVIACDRMLPEFRSTFHHFSVQGLSGEDLAAKTYLFTERPFQFDVPGSAADVRFRGKWRLAVL